MRTTRCGVGCVLMLVGILNAGCGGSAPAPPSVPPPSDGGSDGVEITGGERLGWSQSAPNFGELQSYSYVLYVDNVPGGNLGDLRCGNAAGPTGFDCSGALPALSSGRHVLQVATRGRDGMSDPSAPLVVRVVRATTAPNDAASTTGARSARRPCFVPGGEHCYAAPHVTAVAHEVRSIAALPDGRALIASEAGVFSLDRTGAAPSAALTFNSEIRNASIAVDPLFSHTRFVYLAVTVSDPSGAVVNVVRYRELAGVLGQAATVLSGIPSADSAALPGIVVGDDGRIYLGLSGGSRESAGRSETLYGAILRYEADGTVPRDAAAASPILARVPRFSSLAWHPPGRQLWLSEAGRHSRLWFLDPSQSVLPARPGRVDLPPGREVVSMSAVRRGTDTPGGLFVLMVGRELRWTTQAEVDRGHRVKWSTLSLEREASLVAAWDSSLIWLVAPRREPGSGNAAQVWTLERQ